MGSARRRHCNSSDSQSLFLTFAAVALLFCAAITVPVRVESRVVGPGSWPPTCKWKCGRCMPCRAVNVPIQPGSSAPLEYYPEAWRCKCGDNIFMP